ncbi:MAG: Uma2 family endonuclease [Nocardiopsaceae bacterium]|nr:Uma2 family endonuclease [Nocardiopsaceae bacterium]
MTANRTVWPDDRPMTVEDLNRLPGEGSRYELDDGLLVVTPPPANIHQLVTSRLQTLLDSSCPPEYLVISGNGVEISNTQYRITDLIVMLADQYEATGTSTKRPPVLAVEVASPSTAIYDRNRKKEVYVGFGIESYWIVTPSLDKPRLLAFELQRGSYRQIADFSGDEQFEAGRPFPVTIVPSTLVAGPWQR